MNIDPSIPRDDNNEVLLRQALGAAAYDLNHKPGLRCVSRFEVILRK